MPREGSPTHVIFHLATKIKDFLTLALMPCSGPFKTESFIKFNSYGLLQSSRSELMKETTVGLTVEEGGDKPNFPFLKFFISILVSYVVYNSSVVTFEVAAEVKVKQNKRDRNLHAKKTFPALSISNPSQKCFLCIYHLSFHSFPAAAPSTLFQTSWSPHSLNIPFQYFSQNNMHHFYFIILSYSATTCSVVSSTSMWHIWHSLLWNPGLL